MSFSVFDTHAHYFDARFEKEVPGGADAILSEIMPDPVKKILNVGTNPANSRAAIAQAARYEGMYAAAGIHPEDCHYLQAPDAALDDLRALLGTPETRKRDKLVALGEIGLDYHYENYGEVPLDKAREAYFFDAQMRLAEELGLPVIIHDREAHGDCFDTVCRFPGVRGVFHSCSCSAEMAKDLARRGWYLSFSGSLTFKNANNVRAAALAVPRDRVLVETDCPYLSPVPHRGELNHSGFVVHTVAVLAELWHLSPEETAHLTSENAEALFLR